MTANRNDAAQVAQHLQADVARLVSLAERGDYSAGYRDGNQFGYDQGVQDGAIQARRELGERPTAAEVLRAIAGHLESTMPKKNDVNDSDRAARHRLIAICLELVNLDLPTLAFGNLREVVQAVEEWSP